MESPVIERAPRIDMDAITDVASFLVRTNARIIYPVPYAGDERPLTHVYKPFADGDFWINKPA
ncbi:MAG TPA: hypothetical protein VFH99_00225 [Candidatus Saccharimonadales bacterium]|nr:hypothetical protein [Candidatus Saccharimonadales bacterium]